MKNTENAERPMSAIVYSPSRRGPLRWSGRPAQTSFSSAIRDSRTVTSPSSQRSRRAARQNRHGSRSGSKKSSDCCIRDSPSLAWPAFGEWEPARRAIEKRDSFAFRTAGGEQGDARALGDLAKRSAERRVG